MAKTLVIFLFVTSFLVQASCFYNSDNPTEVRGHDLTLELGQVLRLGYSYDYPSVSTEQEYFKKVRAHFAAYFSKRLILNLYSNCRSQLPQLFHLVNRYFNRELEYRELFPKKVRIDGARFEWKIPGVSWVFTDRYGKQSGLITPPPQYYLAYEIDEEAYFKDYTKLNEFSWKMISIVVKAFAQAALSLESPAERAQLMLALRENFKNFEFEGFYSNTALSSIGPFIQNIGGAIFDKKTLEFLSSDLPFSLSAQEFRTERRNYVDASRIFSFKQINRLEEYLSNESLSCSLTRMQKVNSFLLFFDKLLMDKKNTLLGNSPQLEENQFHYLDFNDLISNNEWIFELDLLPLFNLILENLVSCFNAYPLLYDFQMMYEQTQSLADSRFSLLLMQEGRRAYQTYLLRQTR